LHQVSSILIHLIPKHQSPPPPPPPHHPHPPIRSSTVLFFLLPLNPRFSNSATTTTTTTTTTSAQPQPQPSPRQSPLCPQKKEKKNQEKNNRAVLSIKRPRSVSLKYLATSVGILCGHNIYPVPFPRSWLSSSFCRCYRNSVS